MQNDDRRLCVVTVFILHFSHIIPVLNFKFYTVVVTKPKVNSSGLKCAVALREVIVC